MVILLTDGYITHNRWCYCSQLVLLLTNGAVLLIELCADGFIDVLVFFCAQIVLQMVVLCTDAFTDDCTAHKSLYCSRLVLQVVVSQIFQKSQIHIYEETLFVILVHFVSMEAE